MPLTVELAPSRCGAVEVEQCKTKGGVKMAIRGPSHRMWLSESRATSRRHPRRRACTQSGGYRARVHRVRGWPLALGRALRERAYSVLRNGVPKLIRYAASRRRTLDARNRLMYKAPTEPRRKSLRGVRATARRESRERGHGPRRRCSGIPLAVLPPLRPSTGTVCRRLS